MRKKGRILLLDDDELIISMLARALRKDGYETQLLHSSVGAVEKIIAWQPDMMLLDIELGEELNGLDILKMLHDEHVKFPVVMLTGDADAVGQKVAGRLGLDQAYTELLPADKVERVEELLKQKGLYYETYMAQYGAFMEVS